MHNNSKLTHYLGPLRINPDSAEIYYHLGNAYKKQGKLNDAVRSYFKAIDLKPDMVDAYYNMGNAYSLAGELNKALSCYRKVLEIRPDYLEAYHNASLALKDLGKFKDAISYYHRALELRPDNAEIYYNIGNVYKEQGEFSKAVSFYIKAISLKRDMVEAHYNMGNAFKELDELDKAISCYEDVIQMDPDHLGAYNNMGLAYQGLGKIDRAIEMFDRALRYNNDYPEILWNRSLALLLNGEFREGWKGYVARFRRDGWQTAYPRRFSKPKWDGSAFEGKRLLVHHEQGFGDTIQFVRYLPMVKERGGTVILEVGKELSQLLRHLPGVDELLALSPEDDLSVDFDCFIPLLSLPGLFETTPDTIPAPVPYLHADPAIAAEWNKRLAQTGLRVGVVWAGNPNHKNDHNRSCPLELFAPLTRIPGVCLYGLQKERADQFKGLFNDLGIINLGEELADFTVTAGVIENLDLLITVDTATAHLAGAMGRPVWLLLPYVPDWRWQMERNDSPWYPTMRLFRQKRRGDWGEVITRVAGGIRTLAERPATGASPYRGAGVNGRGAEVKDPPMDVERRVEEGLEYHRSGRLRPAMEIYEEILRNDPGHSETLHLLGNVFRQKGDQERAAQLIERAIRIDPQQHLYHNSLGTVKKDQGRLSEAVSCYEKAIELRPDSAAVLYNLANVFHGQGRFDRAETCYKRAIQIEPVFAPAHGNLGTTLIAQGKIEEGISSYRRAVSLRPDYPEVHNNLGNAFRDEGDLEKAALCYKTALKSRPVYPEALNNLGVVLQGQDRLEEAVSYYRKAVQLRPDFTEAHLNMAFALLLGGRFAEAIPCCRKALGIRPESDKAFFMLGNCLKEGDDFDGAISCYERALRLNPRHTEAYVEMGRAHQENGHITKAIESFGRALSIDNEHPWANLNRSLAYLLDGEYEKGWKGYHWRLMVDDWKLGYSGGFEKPEWDGSPLEGKRILVHHEQALGDEMQFVRYLPMVKERGGTVIFETNRLLFRLFKELKGVDLLLPGPRDRRQLPDFDLYIPLLSLPAIFRSTLETIPSETPYLSAEQDLVDWWADRLGGIPGFKIGICWQGNPSYRNDRHRSVPLRQFFGLAGLDGVQLISLQKGYGLDQLDDLPGGLSIINLGPELDESTGAFVDTAAVMKNLDLIITSDTAIPHLAGALGVPVWMALPHVPDWRWGLRGETCPWYPSMRLFRQGRQGGWTPVFVRIWNEVKGILYNHRSPGQGAP